MIPCVAIAQLNDQPEDEDTYASEIVVLEGKELRIVKYNADPGAFDFDQLTGLVPVLGFEIVVDWEVLDGRAFAVVNRVTPLPETGQQPGQPPVQPGRATARGPGP